MSSVTRSLREEGRVRRDRRRLHQPRRLSEVPEPRRRVDDVQPRRALGKTNLAPRNTRARVLRIEPVVLPHIAANPAEGLAMAIATAAAKKWLTFSGFV